MSSKIIGTGFSVPSNIITNEEIEKKIKNTSNDWIKKNLGIKKRHVCINEDSISLGCESADMAIKNANIPISEIDMIIVCSSSHTMIAPSIASIIKEKLNLLKAVPIDVGAVCSGFLFSLSIADQYIYSGSYKNILIVATDTFSKITDWEDRNCVFFGDGAGSVILSNSNDLFKKLMPFALGSDSIDAYGFQCKNNEYFKMNTKSVYNAAIKALPNIINEVLNKSMLTIDDIDYLVPHQPSIKILTEVTKIIGLPIEKLLTNMEEYGNTVSATIPILLHNNINKFKKKDKILFTSVGSGWTYGAMIYEF